MKFLTFIPRSRRLIATNITSAISYNVYQRQQRFKPLHSTSHTTHKKNLIKIGYKVTYTERFLLSKAHKHGSNTT
jgi:hypothetical protein